MYPRTPKVSALYIYVVGIVPIRKDNYRDIWHPKPEELERVTYACLC